MGQARPVTARERARILKLAEEGMSCGKIAKQLGRSPDTISRIAREAGHTWGNTNLAKAHEAARAYGAEARARTAAKLHAEADRLIADLHKPHVTFKIGGKDNVYTEHQLPEPDVEAKFTIIRAAAQAMRTVLEIDSHDNRSQDVDQAAGLIVQLVDSIRGT